MQSFHLLALAAVARFSGCRQARKDHSCTQNEASTSTTHGCLVVSPERAGIFTLFGVNFTALVLFWLSLLGLLAKIKCDTMTLSFPFLKKIESFKRTLTCWKGRALTMQGKCTVVNLLAASKLWYCCSVYFLPAPVVKQLEDAIWDFVLGASHFVNRTVCQYPVLMGGQGLVDIATRAASFRLSWLARLVDKQVSRWKAFYHYYLNLYRQQNLGLAVLKCKISRYFAIQLPVWYYHTLWDWECYVRKL